MVEITIRANTGLCDTLKANSNEADFYRALGEWMADKDAPMEIEVDTELGSARYSLIPSAGNKFIREDFNNMYFQDVGTYPTVYLTKIDPKWNNYKFYQLEQVGASVVATYGRIGSDSSDRYGKKTHTYDSRMYYIKLSEKLAKGYIDQSSLFLGKEAREVKEEVKPAHTTSQKLYSALLGYAKNYVEKNIVSSVIVTEEMVKESQKILSHIGNLKSVSAFNKWLEKLLVVAPRRIDGTKEWGVKSWLASSKEDFARIIEREEDLVNSMRAVSTPVSNLGFGKSIEVYEATEKQREKVIKRLNPQLQNKVKTVYRVIPHKQKEKFDRYVEENHIHHIKELWHGSRNCNWLSIIKNSLQLNPNAQITGKMFGQGIYFAPQSLKSWGYTSYHGTRWARGGSDTAFMGLYAVAYGKPKNVTSALSSGFCKRDLGSYNCVHAHAGAALLNDEIVFYDEAAILLNYIVEFH